MTLPGAPQPPRSCLDRGTRSPDPVRPRPSRGDVRNNDGPGLRCAGSAWSIRSLARRAERMLPTTGHRRRSQSSAGMSYSSGMPAGGSLRKS